MFYTLPSFPPIYILKIIYNAHVNSLLNYSTPIWCCNYRSNIKPLHLLQKRIIRNVTKSDYQAHSRPFFKQTNILNIYDVNKLFMGSQFKKWPNKYVDPCRPNHNLNTRNNHILRPLQHGLSLVRNSLLVQGVTNYNEIPLNIKLSGSLHSFKRKYKMHLISLY